MRYRRFGRTNWMVSEIGYGMWGMGGWTGSDDAESLAALQRAVELKKEQPLRSDETINQFLLQIQNMLLFFCLNQSAININSFSG